MRDKNLNDQTLNETFHELDDMALSFNNIQSKSYIHEIYSPKV